VNPQRWWRRAALAAGVYLVLEVVFLRVDFEPDAVRLAVLVALVVALGGLVLDSVPDVAAQWDVHTVRPATPPGQDARTSLNLRILESHLTSRTPDGVLRDRLGDLADQVLRVRHDLDRRDPRAVELLGPELHRLLTAEPRRLSRAEIDRSVRRIEEL
jgi:hypothetical protein